MKRAVFPGSFDPFTIGHHDIVCRGLRIFDEIIIGIGVNSDKHYTFPLETRLSEIQKIYADQPRVKVTSYDCLTIDFAAEQQAQFILRGIRTVKDFEYERELADINHRLSGIETVLLYSAPQYSMISSTMLRDLYRYGKDISPYLPQTK